MKTFAMIVIPYTVSMPWYLPNLRGVVCSANAANPEGVKEALQKKFPGRDVQFHPGEYFEAGEIAWVSWS